MHVAQALLDGRKPIGEIASSQKKGFYGIFAKNRNCLPGVTIPEISIIYVGMTNVSLDKRNHFLAKNSGSHSPRRSLGAILKRELNLQAVPRANGYLFSGNGESRLSEWMRQNLDYAILELDHALRSVETATIRTMQPPLNLTDWPNPQRQHIMDLRKACKSEAKALRQHMGQQRSNLD